MKGLIITADDFGAAREINDAVESAHRDGILTAASLMVGAPFAADAAARARQMPSLRVGLHLVLVDGRPVLPASAVPDLVDEAGRFRANMAAAGANMFFNGGARAQLAAEIEAQFEAYRATGLALDHCNAHKHFHLHPVIGRLLARIGWRFGLRAVRVPLEPARVLAKAEPGSRARGSWLTAPWAHILRRRLRAGGLLAPDAVFGLRWSGAMTTARLCGLIRNLPDGLNEIYLHPATNRNFAGAEPGYRYAEELAALTAPQSRQAVRDCPVRFGGFTDFLKLYDGATIGQIQHNAESERNFPP